MSAVLYPPYTISPSLISPAQSQTNTIQPFLTMSSVFTVVQGAHSTTFSTPPLDGSLTFPELLAFHAVHSGSHKLFVYPEDGEIKSIDYATIFRAQTIAASVVKSAFDSGKHLYANKPERPVFGILANAGKCAHSVRS